MTDKQKSRKTETTALVCLALFTFAVTVLSLTVFMETGFHADLDYLIALQDFRNRCPELLNDFFLFITHFGSAKFVLPAVLVIYFGFSTRLGKFLVQISAFSIMVNGLLKLTVCAFRPWFRDELIVPAGNAIRGATGYSFPSGHSTIATALYGGIMIKTRKHSKAMAAAAAAILLCVMFSRNYLGVHTPQDVIAGLTCTLALILAMQKIFRWMEYGSISMKKWMFFIFSAAICTACAVYFEFKTYPVPYDASGSPAADPAKMILNSYQGLGCCLGAAAAMIFLHYFNGYEAENASFIQRAAMILISSASAYLLHRGISHALSDLLAIRYARLAECFIILFWTFALLPALAARFGTGTAKKQQR